MVFRLWNTVCTGYRQDGIKFALRIIKGRPTMNSNTKKRLTAGLLGAIAMLLASDVSAQRKNGGRDKADEQKTERKAPPVQKQQAQDDRQIRQQQQQEARRQQQQQRQVQIQQQQQQQRQQQRQNQTQPQPQPPQRQVWAQQQNDQRRRDEQARQAAALRQQQNEQQRNEQIRQAQQQRQITDQQRQIQIQNAQRQRQQTSNPTTWRQQNGRVMQNQTVVVPQANVRVDRAQQEALRQQRLYQYNQRWNNWQTLSRERTRELQQQRRNAYLAYQQRYWDQIRRDQLALQQARYYDNYYNNYRYNRGGEYYYTSQYGAQMLQQAVNNGYREGFYAGQADRRDGWEFDYQNSFGYQDAALGYNAYYVSYDEYNYYFREGFQRGYEDGFNGRYQYGQYNNGKYAILGSVLGSILQLALN